MNRQQNIPSMTIVLSRKICDPVITHTTTNVRSVKDKGEIPDSLKTGLVSDQNHTSHQAYCDLRNQSAQFIKKVILTG